MRYKLYRIIDVNINRAVEGMRVVEEICRFVIENKKLTSELKKLRGKLGKIIRISEHQKERNRETEKQRIRARKALKDIGRKLYTEVEGKRRGFEDVFRANIKRSQEAVRCLEEFSKLINEKFGKKFKNIRFKLYDLEKRISKALARI